MSSEVLRAALQTAQRARARMIERLREQGIEFVVAQGAGFVFQQHRNAVTHRVGQPRAARDEFLCLAVIGQGAFGDGADQQFKQFGIHGARLARRNRQRGGKSGRR